MKTQLFTAAVCLSIIGSPALSQQANEVYQKAQVQDVQDETFIRVSSLLWDGDFVVDVQSLPGQDAIRIHLEGAMRDTRATGDGVPVDSWNASIEFELPADELDLISAGPIRAMRTNGTPQLYTAELIAPNALLWTSMTGKALGSIEVWNASDADFQLSDSIVVSLLQMMILNDGTGGYARAAQETCTPTFAECVTTATTLCGTNDVKTFSYRCNPSTGEASCEFTCENEGTPPVEPPVVDPPSTGSASDSNGR